MARRFLFHPFGILLCTALLALAGSFRIFPFENDPIWFSSSFFPVFAVGKALFFMLFVPLVFLGIFRENIQEFGFRFPEKGRWKITLPFFVGIGGIALAASFIPALRAYYALPSASVPFFFAAAGILPALYYLAEEFLFRGFLLFGLARTIGPHAIWVGSVLFAAFHLGKPSPEAVISFFLGVLFSFVALKTKSFLPAAALHFLLALMLNILATFVWYAGEMTGAVRF